MLERQSNSVCRLGNTFHTSVLNFDFFNLKHSESVNLGTLVYVFLRGFTTISSSDLVLLS